MGLSYLSIVLPTINERENLELLIPEITKTFLPVVDDLEIIIVDDASIDGTLEFVESYPEDGISLRIISRNERLGIGSALIEGYNNCNGDVIISSDADLSFSVEDMLALYELINSGSDMVIGVRHKRGSTYTAKKLPTKIKKLVSTIGNRIISIRTGVKISDFTANFRAMKKTTWDKIETDESSNPILYDMIVKASKNGDVITEHPITFSERVHGESKLNLSKEIFSFLRKLIFKR